MMRYYLFSYQDTLDPVIPVNVDELYVGMFEDLLEARIEADTDDILMVVNPETGELEVFAQAYDDTCDISYKERFILFGWWLRGNEKIECYQKHEVLVDYSVNIQRTERKWIDSQEGE